MAVTVDDINGFADFALQRVNGGIDALCLEELVGLWRLECRTLSEVQADAIAIKVAVDDFENGDCGVPVENVINELRRRHGA